MYPKQGLTREDVRGETRMCPGHSETEDRREQSSVSATLVMAREEGKEVLQKLLEEIGGKRRSKGVITLPSDILSPLKVACNFKLLLVEGEFRLVCKLTLASLSAHLLYARR